MCVSFEWFWGTRPLGRQGWREVGAPRLYTIIRSWIRPFVAVCARTGREAPPPGCTAREIRTARPAGAAHAAPPPAGRRTRRPFPCRLPCGTVTQSFAKFGHLAAAQHVGTTHVGTHNSFKIHATEKPQPNARHTTQRRETQAFLFPTERGGWRDTMQCYISTESSFKANTTCVLYATLQGQLSCQIVRVRYM